MNLCIAERGATVTVFPERGRGNGEVLPHRLQQARTLLRAVPAVPRASGSSDAWLYVHADPSPVLPCR